jgi:hypothetical protein
MAGAAAKKKCCRDSQGGVARGGGDLSHQTPLDPLRQAEQAGAGQVVLHHAQTMGSQGRG